MVSGQVVGALIVFEHGGVDGCVFNFVAVSFGDHFFDKPLQGKNVRSELDNAVYSASKVDCDR